MKTLLLIITISLPTILFGQVPNAQSLLGLHTVTSAEKNAITGATAGMMLYDTDEESVYVYTTSFGWQKLQNGPSTYTGSFIISAAGAQTISGIPFKPSGLNVLSGLIP